jgi:hypothetical protein
MKLTRSAGWIAGAVCSLALGGCLGTEKGVADDAINTAPSSLSEANAEMDKIDRIMAESGSTPELVEKQHQIRDRIDIFSGLVDRIEIAPGHSINFFLAPDGDVSVNERMRIGDRPAMRSNSAESIPAIYERLAPGRAIPAALKNTPAIQTGNLSTGPSEDGNLSESEQVVADNGIGTEQAALTDSPEDGLWFVDNYCNMEPEGTIVYRGACVIDKVGGRYSMATADHTQVALAFTRGTGSILLRRRPSAGGTIQGEWRIFEGEVHWVWSVGPWKDVRDSGCWPPPFACGTHREAQRIPFRWSAEGASGKKYNMTTVFYNNPEAWNWP